ncbi:tyrosine-type recombinase/integrase [Candidatus Neomarinimicrobiota bacterium]
MVGLRKLKGKYYGRLRLNGKDKLLPLNTSYKAEADRMIKIYNENEALIKAGLLESVERNKMPTLVEAIHIFLNESKNKGLNQTTVKHYGYALKHLSDNVNNISIDKITESDCDKLKTFLLNTYARPTVNSYLKSINAFFGWIEKKLKIGLPPRIQLINAEKILPEFLIPDELDRIYQLCEDEKMLSTFKIYEHTGIRLRELHNCELDITKNGTYIKLKRTKGKRERIIPIPTEVVADFKIATKGGIYKPDRISRAFSKLRDKAKLNSNKSLHSLRHTFALRKLLELGNIYLVKEMLGHSDVTTTQIYLQFPDGYIKEVLSDWLPQINDKVDNETMKIAKLLHQNGYSQSLKN